MVQGRQVVDKKVACSSAVLREVWRSVDLTVVACKSATITIPFIVYDRSSYLDHHVQSMRKLFDILNDPVFTGFALSLNKNFASWSSRDGSDLKKVNKQEVVLKVTLLKIHMKMTWENSDLT